MKAFIEYSKNWWFQTCVIFFTATLKCFSYSRSIMYERNDLHLRRVIYPQCLHTKQEICLFLGDAEFPRAPRCPGKYTLFRVLWGFFQFSTFWIHIIHTGCNAVRTNSQLCWMMEDTRLINKINIKIKKLIVELFNPNLIPTI